MRTSGLSRRKRVATVLNGGIPDRVPCIPLVYYFAANYSKTPYPRFIKSMKAFRQALDKCFWEVGPWDAMYTLPITMDAPDYDIVFAAGVGMKPTFPEGSAEALQSFQFVESEPLMKETDYERIQRCPSQPTGLPYHRLVEILVSRAAKAQLGNRFRATYMWPHLARLGFNWFTENLRWRLKGVPVFPGFSLEAPFDTLSMARGLVEFCQDIRHRPDMLRSAVLKLSEAYAHVARRVCKILRTKNFLLLVHRSSNDFVSPTHYRRIIHPSIKLIAEELHSHGIIMGMHCDGNWDRNVELMTDLPKNTYFQFDGFTDVFRARRILGNNFTIMGDVHPTLLAHGTAEEVEQYAAKLIDEVGRDGRFILSSGCELPPNTKLENIRAMTLAARKYGVYR